MVAKRGYGAVLSVMHEIQEFNPCQVLLVFFKLFSRDDEFYVQFIISLRDSASNGFSYSNEIITKHRGRSVIEFQHLINAFAA